MQETQKEIGKKNYVLSDEVKEVAKTVLSKNRNRLDGDYDRVKVEYMKVYPDITPTTAGRCVRASKLLKFFSDSDVVIEVSGELWDKLPESTREILMLHEMMHVGTKWNKKGEMSVGLVRHDVQDFYLIVKEYGIEWLETIRSVIANINDFQDGQEIKTTL